MGLAGWPALPGAGAWRVAHDDARGEVAHARGTMRPDARTSRDLGAAPRGRQQIRAAGRHSWQLGEVVQQVVAVPVEVGQDDLFVFPWIKGAGGIDQDATRSYQLSRAFQQVLLAPRASLHVFKGPVGTGELSPAKHRLAGTRRIDQHFVKEALLCCGQLARVALRDNGGPCTPLFQRSHKVAGATPVDVVARQQALAQQTIEDGGGLAARSRAKVQDTLARPRIE